MKIVINKCYGGFSISHKALALLCEMGNAPAIAEAEWCKEHPDPRLDRLRGAKGAHHVDNLQRNDPQLVAAVEQLGIDEASGSLALLRIVEIPDGIEWEIDEYDGMESVSEKHRTWG